MGRTCRILALLIKPFAPEAPVICGSNLVAHSLTHSLTHSLFVGSGATRRGVEDPGNEVDIHCGLDSPQVILTAIV